MQSRPVHLVGIAGTGMSALAEALLDAGEAVTGSDRFLDAEEPVPALAALRAQGVALFPQDGSGVTPATARVVASVAVEDDNPDLAAARRLGVPVARRADELSALLSRKRLVAVAGTCGKSTTTAILGHLLACAGLAPTVVNGAPCLNWAGPARTGAVLRGDGPLCVAEVDESSRQILAFRPDAALLLNASADHFPLDETNALFDRFLSQVRGPVVDARGDVELAGVAAGHEDLAAGIAVSLGQHAAQRAGGAGDEGDLALNREHVLNKTFFYGYHCCLLLLKHPDS